MLDPFHVDEGVAYLLLLDGPRGDIPISAPREISVVDREGGGWMYRVVQQQTLDNIDPPLDSTHRCCVSSTLLSIMEE